MVAALREPGLSVHHSRLKGPTVIQNKSIADRINELETDDASGLMVSKQAVLDIVADAISFQTEPYGDTRDLPEDGGELLHWQTLDTALRVIAIGAAKINLWALRETVGEDVVFTDAELVAQAAERHGHPATLAHVASASDRVGALLSKALDAAVGDTCDRFSEAMAREAGK